MPMSTLASLGSAFYAATNAFRKSYLASSTQSLDVGTTSSHTLDVFSSWEARRARYALYWAYYENSAYDSVHQWAKQYKTEYSLYRYTRGAYNPFNRLGEFWASRLLGGTLDPDAGDGRSIPSALPILTSNDALRPAIGQLWRDSGWQVNKDVLSRMGSVLGDVALKVDDDPERGSVTLEVVDPSTLRWVQLDRRGNVRGYIIEERRLDPDYDPRRAGGTLLDNSCIYREEAFRDGELLTYATYKNGQPYAWNGRESSWTVDYGFVPMVLIQHQKVSACAQWGLSEFHAALPKAREVDDLGSNLHDQIRKAVWPKWMFSGVQDPSRSGRSTRFGGNDPTVNDTEPGREEVGAIYAGPGATAYPLLFPLDVQFTSLEIRQQLDNLERDYPELQLDSSRVSGDASGKAQVEARRKTTAKVHSRRVIYDDASVRAFQMALAIGGYRGYEGYEGFDLDSYARGDLAMRIDVRPVFELDQSDVIAEQAAFWTAADMATRAGYPLEAFLLDAGKSPDQIERFRTLRDEQDQRNLAMATSLAAAKQPALAPAPASAPAGA